MPSPTPKIIPAIPGPRHIIWSPIVYATEGLTAQQIKWCRGWALAAMQLCWYMTDQETEILYACSACCSSWHSAVLSLRVWGWTRAV